jgi:hypothetical protein
MNAPQVQHTVHANVMQADAIGSQLANADALACSKVGPHAAKSKGVLDAKTCTVEHVDSHEATPNQRGRRKTNGEQGSYNSHENISERTPKKNNRIRTDTRHNRRQAHLSPSTSTTSQLLESFWT